MINLSACQMCFFVWIVFRVRFFFDSLNWNLCTAIYERMAHRERTKSSKKPRAIEFFGLPTVSRKMSIETSKSGTLAATQ